MGTWFMRRSAAVTGYWLAAGALLVSAFALSVGCDGDNANSTSSSGASSSSGGSGAGSGGGGAGAGGGDVGAASLRLYNVGIDTVDPRWTELPETLSRVQLTPSFTLLAQVPAEVQSVRFSVDGGEPVLDTSAPFRLTEEADGEAASWMAENGTHQLNLETFASADGSGAPLATLAKSFTISDTGLDPTPTEGEHTIVKLWRTASGKLVQQNQNGDFVDPDGNTVLAASEVSLVEMGNQQLHYVSNNGAPDSIAFAFIVALPDGYDASVPYPLLVFLHHGWEVYRGTDNDGRPLETPLFEGPLSITASDSRHHFPAIVLVPQMVRKESIAGVEHEWAAFTDLSNTTGSVTSANEASSNALPVFDVIDELIAGTLDVDGSKPTVDSARVYLAGHSMGGLGTWDWLARKPTLWAAGVPMAGYPDHAKAPDLTEMPIWSFHHENDCYNPYVGSETMHQLISGPPNNGTLMRLTKLTFDTGGQCDQAHFQTPNGAWNDQVDLLGWMFSQVR